MADYFTPDTSIEASVPDYFTPVTEEETPVAPMTALGAAHELVVKPAVGAIETVASGLSNVVGKAAAGIVSIGTEVQKKISPDLKPTVTPEEVEQGLTYKPQTEAGKQVSELASVPFEWWDTEGQRITQLNQEGLEFLLVEQGLDRDISRHVAGIVGAGPGSVIRAIPYLLGFKGKGISPEAIPKRVGEKGVVPEEFVTPEEPQPSGWKEKPPIETKESWQKIEEDAFKEQQFIEENYDPTLRVKQVGERQYAFEKDVVTNDTVVGKYEGLVDEIKGELTVRTQNIEEGYTGQGLGTRTLKEIVDTGLARGYTIKSDAVLSEPAAMTWEKLSDTGEYIVERNPEAKLEETPAGPRLRSEEVGVPVFKIYESKLADKPATPVSYIQVQEMTKALRTKSEVEQALTKDLPYNPSRLVVDERPFSEFSKDLYKTSSELTKKVKIGKEGPKEPGTVLLKHKATYPDLPDRYGAISIKEGGKDVGSLIPFRGKYIPGKFVATYTRNPVVKWVTSQVGRERIWVAGEFDRLYYGSEIQMVRGIPRSVPTREGWRTRFEELSLEEQVKVIEARNFFDSPDNLLPTPEQLKRFGLSDKAADMYYHDTNIISQPTKTHNRTAADINKVGFQEKEFPMYDTYNPHIWEGDFYMYVKNKNGDTVRTYRSNNPLELSKREREFKEEFGEKYSYVRGARRDRTNDMAVEAINDLTAKLKEQFPEDAAALDAFMASRVKPSGMGVHGLSRKGAEGYLGDFSTTKDPKKLVNDFIKSRETFLWGMTRSTSNLRLRYSMNQLKSDPVLKRLYKNSIDYSSNYVDNYMGRKPITDELISAFTAKMVGQSGVKRGVELSQTAMTYPVLLLGSVPNIMIQPFQIPYGQIKAHALRNTLGLDATQVHTAWARGMMDMIKKDADALDVAKTAGKMNAINPGFIEHMYEIEALQGKPIAHSQLWKDIASGKLLYSVPDQYSRLAQIHGFYRVLREAGKSHEIAKMDAIELGQRYSVEYNPAERPAAFRGTVGNVVGKFSTWSSNQYGQMLEYVDAARMGDVQPLAAYLAYSALIGGLYGFWGVQEGDALVAKVNEKFQTDYSLPSMVIAEHAPDWLAYGPMQSTLDYTTGTAVMPSFNRRFTNFAAVDFYKEVISSTSNLVSKYMGVGSPPTKLDTERALLSVAPRSIHPVIKHAVATGEITLLAPGESVVITDPKTGKGIFRQDRQTQITNYLGGRTKEEMKLQMVNRWVQSVEANRKLTVQDWAKYVAINQSMGLPIDMTKFAESIAAEHEILPQEFFKAVQTQAENFNTDLKQRLFDIKTTKGKRAGKRFFEDRSVEENTDIPDYFIEDK